MKFSNRFKIIWWVALLLITSSGLIFRFNAIKNGISVPFDVFLFLIWVALMLVPVFSEIEFLGIKLKKEIEDLKSQINIKFGDLRNEIKLNQSQNLTANIGYGPPPPDDRIAEIKQQLDILIKDKTRHPILIDVPKDNVDLFKVRFYIEKEINRIWIGRYDSGDNQLFKRRVPMYKQIQELQQFEIIDGNMGGLLRDMLAICNFGIHGEDISKNQVEFVNEYSEKVINYLKDIK